MADVLNEFLEALASGQTRTVAGIARDIARVWRGSDASVTPVLTTPSGSHWLPSLGVELSADLTEVRKCSVQDLLDRIPAARRTTL